MSIVPEFYSDSIENYRDLVASRVESSDPIDLLKRQRDLFGSAFGNIAAAPYDQLIDGELGTIGDMTCLQQALFDTHLSRLDSPLDLVEFQVCSFSPEGTLTVLALYGNKISPPLFENIQSIVQGKLADGYRFVSHIHNHPFVVENSTGDYGDINSKWDSVRRRRYILLQIVRAGLTA